MSDVLLTMKSVEAHSVAKCTRRRKIYFYITFIILISLLYGCYNKSKKRHEFLLSWPLAEGQGEVVIKPGKNINQIWGNTFANDRVFIAGIEGESVYSPYSGTVKNISNYSINDPDLLGAWSWDSLEEFKNYITNSNQVYHTESNLSSELVLETEDGKTIILEGITDFTIKEGEVVKVGDKIGSLGYVRMFYSKPCITIGGGQKDDIIVFSNNPDIKYDGYISNDPKWNPKKTLSKKEALEDFDLYIKCIVEDHPALFNSKIKNVFQEYVKKQRQELKRKISYREFEKIILKSNAILRCSHTGVKKLSGSTFNTSFPLFIEYKDEIATVIHDRRGYNKIPSGSQVLSINGRGITNIYNEIESFFGFDSISNSVKKENLSGILSFYDSFNAGSLFYRIKIQNDKNKIMNLFVKKLSKQEQLNPLSVPEYMRGKEESSFFEVSELGVAKITLSRIDQASNKEKIKEIFKEISLNDVSKLIIDLRDNPGGLEENAAYFFSFLSKEKFSISSYSQIRHKGSFISIENSENMQKYSEHGEYLKFSDYKDNGTGIFMKIDNLVYEPSDQYNFNGHMEVIVNGGTSSAAVRLAKLIKDSGGLVSGTETSGGVYACNAVDVANVVLPNSKLIVKIPLFRVIFEEPSIKAVKADPDIWYRGLRPDNFHQ